MKLVRNQELTCYLYKIDARVMLFYEGSGYGRPRPHQLCKMDTSTYKRHKCLPEALQTTFKKCWVILKSSRKKFSNMSKEQAHEQNNSILKGSGGTIGILENPEAPRRSMVAGPEVERCLTNFEDDFCSVIHNRNDEESTTNKIVPNREPSRITSEILLKSSLILGILS